MAILVSFDGIDGCGKTTTIQHFKSKLENLDLRDKGINRILRVANTKLIGTTDESIAFRKLVLDGKLSKHEEALGFLYHATHFYRQWIKEHQSNYDFILIDRSRASFYAYQIFGRGFQEYMPMYSSICGEDDATMEMNYFYIKGNKAKHKEMIIKERNELDFFESMDSSFHAKVYNGFEDYMARQKSVISISSEQIEQDYGPGIDIFLKHAYDAFYNRFVANFKLPE